MVVFVARKAWAGIQEVMTMFWFRVLGRLAISSLVVLIEAYFGPETATNFQVQQHYLEVGWVILAEVIRFLEWIPILNRWA
jgi:hypothetical protein